MLTKWIKTISGTVKSRPVKFRLELLMTKNLIQLSTSKQLSPLHVGKEISGPYNVSFSYGAYHRCYGNIFNMSGWFMHVRKFKNVLCSKFQESWHAWKQVCIVQGELQLVAACNNQLTQGFFVQPALPFCLEDIPMCTASLLVLRGHCMVFFHCANIHTWNNSNCSMNHPGRCVQQ